MNADVVAAPAVAETPDCSDCRRPPLLCLCAHLEPQATRVPLVVLQHPQEQDRMLGTLPLLRRGLRRAHVQVGLSWPNLKTAVGKLAPGSRRWAVAFPMALPRAPDPKETEQPVLLWDRHGTPITAAGVDGLIVIDGSWQQAKALWWRNPWLLRLGRVLLQPERPSIYGRLRREPSHKHLSTLEAAAQALVAVGEPDAVRQNLERAFRMLMQRLRDAEPKVKRGGRSGRRPPRRAPAAQSPPAAPTP